MSTANVNMRIILVIFALIAVSSGYVNVTRGYHEAIGIPSATRIKAAEEALAEISKRSDAGRIVGGSVAPVNSHPYLVSKVSNYVPTTFMIRCQEIMFSKTRSPRSLQDSRSST